MPVCVRACVRACVFVSGVPCVDVLLLVMTNSEETLKAMILEIDPDHDGKISREEFLKITQQVGSFALVFLFARVTCICALLERCRSNSSYSYVLVCVRQHENIKGVHTKTLVRAFT